MTERDVGTEDIKFVRLAIEKAKESIAHGGFPAGAVIVKNGHTIGSGISVGNKLSDPTSHGEMVAIRDACKNLQSSDLTGAVLYTSMQPCIMCFGASIWGMISRIVFAVSKEKVSAEYYGGEYKLSNINSSLMRPIDLVHCAELENESLALVHKWEETFTKGK